MSFDKTGWKAVGGEGQPYDKGKIFSYYTTDDMATVRASGYFNDVSNDLDSEYTVLVRASDAIDWITLTRDATGLILTTDTRVQSLSGAGAANLTTLLTEVTSTDADAVTLANGYVGQIKVVTLIVDGGTMTLTPATALGYTNIAFADAGDSVTLMYMTGGWAIIGQGGLTTGPLSA